MSSAFTTRNNTLNKRLINEATVVYNKNNLKVKALWDTGATGTCISKDVAQSLSMVSTGKKDIHTPSSTEKVNTYLLDIVLPNKVEIKDVEVCETEIGNQGIDMLIGMDIILVGDFVVSNYDNKTVFSFRIPPKKEIDFVKQIKIEETIGPKHGTGKRKRKHK